MASISGLSGLDTANIVNQLMQLEALPQTQLKTRQSTEQSKQAAYRSLNTELASLKEKAAALADAGNWQTLKGTVTGGSGVSANVSASATPGSFTVKVDQVAAKHQLGFNDAAALDDVVTSGPTVKLTTHDGTVHELDAGTGSLEDLAAAINASTADTGVEATVVKVADGSYRLLASSTTTGLASSFTLTNDDGSDLLGGATVTAGKDAQITLGGGITATSATNTFTGLMPGVDLTLDQNAAIGSTSTVTIAQDPTAISDQVKALVAQLNKMLTSIDTQTATKTGSTSAGTLAGDATLRSVRNALIETVFGGTGTMATAGIQTDRYGKLVFDEAKFKESYAADPAAVAAMFTEVDTDVDPDAVNGWAARLEAVAEAASGRNGSITKAIASEDETIKRLGDQIADWDARLELRRTTLQRQYTALETALSNMNAQSSWLTSQLASLSANSSS